MSDVKTAAKDFRHQQIGMSGSEDYWAEQGFLAGAAWKGAKYLAALEEIELHVAYALEEHPDGDPKEMLKLIGEEVRLALYNNQEGT